MTPKDWLKLNPNHKVTLTAEPGDEVKAVFHGGEGIDIRFTGRGTNDTLALGDGLRVRRLLAERLSGDEASLGTEHNALHDARWLRRAHRFAQGPWLGKKPY